MFNVMQMLVYKHAIGWRRPWSAQMGRTWLDLKLSVHEGMKGISNVKVHLKTRSGNVNIE